MSSAPRKLIGQRQAAWIALGVGLLHVYMASSVSRHFSTTFDEIAHVTAGYAYWTADDMRFQPENGNFPQRWAALPLLFLDVNPLPAESPGWAIGQVWQMGETFFYESGNDSARILAAARFMIALLSGALCFTLYYWSRGLFGPIGGLVTVGLATFSPTMLAHGGLATSDTAASLSFCWAVIAWWRVCHRVTLGRILLAGLAAGLLAVSKFSAALFAPMAVIMVVARLCRPAPLVVQGRGMTRWLRGRSRILALMAVSLIAGLIAWSTIWAFYGFRFKPTTDPARQHYMHTWDALLLEETPEARLLADGRNASEQPVDFTPGALQALTRICLNHELFPEAFLHGLLKVDRYSRSRLAFFAGEFRNTGWWTFFPTAFLLKTTIPALLLIAGGLFAFTKYHHRRGRWYRVIPLLVLFGVYGTTILTSSLSIGHRHMLPLYPVMFVLAGGLVILFANKRALMLLVALSLGVHVVISISTRPYYLAYFNPIGGGSRHAYKLFVDSSLDWGQDLPGLKKWLSEHPDDRPAYLSYFGYGDPEELSLNVVRFGDSYFDRKARVVPAHVTGGTYCISATMLQRVYTPVRGPWTMSFEKTYLDLRNWVNQTSLHAEHGPISDLAGVPLTDAQVTARLWNYEALQFGRLCHFLQFREPDDNIGYSILIYRLTDEEVALALNGSLAAVNTAIEARLN